MNNLFTNASKQLDHCKGELEGARNLWLSYATEQAEWVRMTGLKVGDLVMALEKFEREDTGWSSSWISIMQVGVPMKVLRIPATPAPSPLSTRREWHAGGIQCQPIDPKNGEGFALWYPYQVLVKLPDQPKEESNDNK